MLMRWCSCAGGHRCTHLQATGVELQQEVSGLAGGQEQQAVGAGGSEAEAQLVAVGRLGRLELHKAVAVEGSWGKRQEGDGDGGRGWGG